MFICEVKEGNDRPGGDHDMQDDCTENPSCVIHINDF